MSLIRSIISKFVVIQSNSKLLIKFSCNSKTSYENLHCNLMPSYLCVHKITQWLPSYCLHVKRVDTFNAYCLHVKRVKRLCYVHNIDTFNAMSKGSHNIDHSMSKGSKDSCYVHNIDTFNAMLKGSKDYVMHTV